MALGPFASYLPPGVYGPVLGSRYINNFCHCGKLAVVWYNAEFTFDYIIGMCTEHILPNDREPGHFIELTPEEVTVRIVMDE